MSTVVTRLPGQKFCTNCGGTIDANAEICPKCGVRQMAPPVAKSKIVAGLLGIFLGGFGIHKFYLDRPGQGIVYLIFCWTMIPAIIGFIEGIVYLCTNDANFAQKYG
jgi:TM2 domain-containing membrane protein YozV